jgi:hypothetical protein
VRRFLFKLALALGRTVRELEGSISSAELSEWIAYNAIDPMPDPAYEAGLQCAVMANMWTSKGKAKPEDFMRLARPVRILSGEEGLAFFSRLKAIQDVAVGTEIRP